MSIVAHHELAGVLRHLRSEPGSKPCACCPEGAHVYSYWIEPTSWRSRISHHNDLTGWVSVALYQHRIEHEGKPVRVTIELLESSSDRQEEPM